MNVLILPRAILPATATAMFVILSLALGPAKAAGEPLFAAPFLYEVQRDLIGMRVRRSRAFLQSGRSFGFVSTHPLVPGLPADPVVEAQIAEAGPVLQIRSNELQTFGHPIGPRPRHRVVLLGPSIMLRSCNPCPRSKPSRVSANSCSARRASPESAAMHGTRISPSSSMDPTPRDQPCRSESRSQRLRPHAWISSICRAGGSNPRR